MNAYRKYIKSSIFADHQINTVFQIFILAIVGLVAMLIGIPYIAAQGFMLLLYTSPLWIMFLIPKSFWFYWLHYIQHKNIDVSTRDGVGVRGAAYSTEHDDRVPKEVARQRGAVVVV
jgi:hypothetical protein